MPAATCSIIIGNNVCAYLSGTGTRKVSMVSQQIPLKTNSSGNFLPLLYLHLLTEKFQSEFTLNIKSNNTEWVLLNLLGWAWVRDRKQMVGWHPYNKLNSYLLDENIVRDCCTSQCTYRIGLF